MGKPLRTTKRKVRTDDRKRKVRYFQLGEGLSNVSSMREEIADMTDVLMGREDPPVAGRLSLMEVADAYFARACEMTGLIQGKELDGSVDKGSVLYKFRTGELRTVTGDTQYNGAIVAPMFGIRSRSPAMSPSASA